MSIELAFRLQQPGGFSLDVEFFAPAQGVTALFGHSGCGKTTVLRCIAGLQRAQGRCRVNDQTWQDERHWTPPHRRPVGYVFQEASLFPHLDVERNLEYAARASRRRLSPARRQEIMELLDIGKLLKRRPPNLSGGERQRVAVARALLSEPRLLLMDEPLSALDHAAKEAILPYLERLHDELQLPVIYVTHDPEEVARLADRMVLLRDGKVIASGPVAGVMSSLRLPLSGTAKAAAVLEGQVVAHDDTYHLTTITCGDNRFLVPREDLQVGARARLQVHARDVSLALSSHHDTSIANVFPAQIVDTHDSDPAQMLIQLRLEDGQSLLARITRRSGVALGLREGMLVYAQVKGVALLG